MANKYQDKQCGSTDSGEENMTRREIRDKIFKIVFTAEFNTLDEIR